MSLSIIRKTHHEIFHSKIKNISCKRSALSIRCYCTLLKSRCYLIYKLLDKNNIGLDQIVDVPFILLMRKVSGLAMLADSTVSLKLYYVRCFISTYLFSNVAFSSIMRCLPSCSKLMVAVLKSTVCTFYNLRSFLLAQVGKRC